MCFAITQLSDRISLTSLQCSSIPYQNWSTFHPYVHLITTSARNPAHNSFNPTYHRGSSIQIQLVHYDLYDQSKRLPPNSTHQNDQSQINKATSQAISKTNMNNTHKSNQSQFSNQQSDQHGYRKTCVNSTCSMILSFLPEEDKHFCCQNIAIV